MNPRIELRSCATPEQVLAAIRGDVAEWRESRIPKELREQGLCRVEVRISSQSFEVSMSSDSDEDDIQLWGEVRDDGAGGSKVTATCGEPHPFRGARCLAVLGVAVLAFHSAIGGVLLLLAAGASTLGEFAKAARLHRGDHPVAGYLLSRLRRVVTELDAGGSDTAP
jgi:hypothetical protein